MVFRLLVLVAKEITPDHMMNVKKLFKKNGITEQITYKEYNSPQSLQMALVTGKCVSIMFHYIVDGIEGKVQFCPIDVDLARHGMVIVYADDKYMP